MRDSLGHVLQHFIQAAQRGIGFLRSSMCHLERREAFKKELLNRLGHLRSLRGCAATWSGGTQRPVKQYRHFHDTQPVGKRLAPQLVGAPQDSFPPTGKILLQRRGVLGQ